MYASIAHLLDLHENWYDLANFSAKVLLENVVCVSVENLDERAQVPLFRVRSEAFIGHQCLSELDHVLSSQGALQAIRNIQTKLDDELVHELRHKHFNVALEVFRAHLRRHAHHVSTCQHIYTLCLLKM